MKRLGQALIELTKTFIPRSPKSTESSSTQVHWTKADKPLNKMTPQERANFSKKLAVESLSALTSRDEPTQNDKKKLSVNLLSAILILILSLVIYSNWNKIPVFGDNAKARKYVEKVCSKDLQIKFEDRVIAAEKALALDSRWLRLANAYRDLQVSTFTMKQLVELGLEDSQEYRLEYSKLAGNLITANNLCVSFS